MSPFFHFTVFQPNIVAIVFAVPTLLAVAGASTIVIIVLLIYKYKVMKNKRQTTTISNIYDEVKM